MAKDSPPTLSESDIQAQVVEWLRLFEVPCGFMVHSVPNEGKDRANPARLAKLKRMGFRAGVADLVIVKAGRVYFLEMKRPGENQSPNQTDFAVDAHRVGAPYAVAHSFEEAEKIVKNWQIIP